MFFSILYLHKTLICIIFTKTFRILWKFDSLEFLKQQGKQFSISYKNILRKTDFGILSYTHTRHRQKSRCQRNRICYGLSDACQIIFR